MAKIWEESGCCEQGKDGNEETDGKSEMSRPREWLGGGFGLSA